MKKIINDLKWIFVSITVWYIIERFGNWMVADTAAYPCAQVVLGLIVAVANLLTATLVLIVIDQGYEDLKELVSARVKA